MSQYLVDQNLGHPQYPCHLQQRSGGSPRGWPFETVRVLNRGTGEVAVLPAAAMFIFIGAVPRTEMVAGLVERNPAGFILTGSDLMRNGAWPASWPLNRDPYLLETSCPGIFAAGDVCHGSVKHRYSSRGRVHDRGAGASISKDGVDVSYCLPFSQKHPAVCQTYRFRN